MDNKQADLIILFDVYCDEQISSKPHSLKSFEEIGINELIISNIEIAYIYLHSDITDKKKVFWMNKLFVDCGFKDYDQLLSLLQEDSELIRNNVRKIILDKEKKTQKLLEAMIPNMEEDLQGWADRILKYWEYNSTPKSKIQIRNKQEALDYSSKHIEFYCSQQITWVPQKLYTLLHWVGETDMTEYIPRYVIRYVLSEYMTLPKPTRIHACDAIVALINPKEWHDFIETLYQNWLTNGAKVSEKEILAPYCMYARESEMAQLRIQIKSWAKNANKELVDYSLQLLRARGSVISLSILNELMELPNDITLKRNARENFEEIARMKRLSVEEMADKVIPSLGFNRLGEQTVNYGSRAFKVTLFPDMTISVYDLVKKTTSVKLPPPAKNDDFEMAEEKRRELGFLKTLCNIQVHLQKHRLEKALKKGRTWSKKSWKSTFVNNPFMRFLAPGLIWGVYKDNKITESFLCMKNGILVTASGEEYMLPDDGIVSLVHPIDLTDHMAMLWKEQFDHYNLTPFISQLDIPFCRLNDFERKEYSINLFTGKPALLSNIYKYVMPSTSILIINQFLYIIDRSMSVLIQIPYIIENRETLLKELYFSSIGKDDDFSTMQLPKEDRLPLSSFSDRQISDVLYLLSKAFPLK